MSSFRLPAILKGYSVGHSAFFIAISDYSHLAKYFSKAGAICALPKIIFG